MDATNELNIKLGIVNKRLQEIADLTGRMALVGSAKPGYPPYDALDREFDRMLEVSDELLKKLRDTTSH